MPLLAAPVAILALLMAPEPTYAWPAEVIVCSSAADGGAQGWALTLLPEGVAVRVLRPAEWLTDRSACPLVLVRRSALDDSLAASALDRALERGRTVVLAEGLAPGASTQGIGAAPLAPGWREVSDGRWVAPRLGPVGLDSVVLPSAEALVGARADALRPVGRKEPEGASGIALRWAAGPREGARLLIAPCGNIRDLARCLAWADGPFLTRAECDYALVREGEDLRIEVAGAARRTWRGGLRLRLAVTGTAGGPSWRETLELPGPAEASGSGDRLWRFSARQIVPGRSWRAPSVDLRAELLGPTGGVLDRLCTRAVVEPTDMPATKRPPPSVTWRRLALATGTAPVFGVDLGLRPLSLPHAPESQSDMRGWDAALAELGDAGCGVVCTRASTEPASGEPEWSRRWNRARVFSALRAGIAPELLLERPVSGRELLGDDPAGEPIAGRVLVRAGDAAPLLDAGWPSVRIVPPPTDLDSADGWLPFDDEIRCAASVEVVRSRARALTPTRLWASLALGDGGVAVNATDGATPSLAAMLEASLVSRLLLPGGQPQRVGVLVPDGEAQWAMSVADELDQAGYDWSPWRQEATHDWPGATRALVLRAAGGLGEGSLVHLRAWLEVGGSLVAPRLDFANLAPDVSGGDVWRVGQGSLGAWEAGAGSPLSQTLSALGITPLLPPEGRRARVVRNVTADGGEVVVLFPRAGVPARAQLPVAGHLVEVGCAPRQPAAAAGPDTGPWLVSGLGSVAVDGTEVLRLASTERATLISLDGQPLLTSHCLLLLTSGEVEAVLTGAIAHAADVQGYAVRCSGRVVSLEPRGLRRSDDGVRALPRDGDAGRPLLVASRGLASSAQRRLGDLLWGRR